MTDSSVLEDSKSGETSAQPRSGLARLLRPRSIAIAGANPDPRTMGGTILANCERFGFSDSLYLISPTRTEIGGKSCLKSLNDLPEGVDAVVLSVPRAAIRAAVESCIARGVGGVVVFAAGFAKRARKAGRNRTKSRRYVAKLAWRSSGRTASASSTIAIRRPLTFEPVSPSPIKSSRTVAVLAQSGATASSIRAAMQGRGITVSIAAATGNEAVVRSEDIIEYLIDEGAATAIALYVEQIRNPGRFLEVAPQGAREARPHRHASPRQQRTRPCGAAASHTGSMVGDYAVMRTAIIKEGVVLVETMDELYDTVALLYRFPQPPLGDIGIITNSGAIRGMSFDFADAIDLPLAALAPATIARMKGFLADGLEAENPLDVGTSGFGRRQRVRQFDRGDAGRSRHRRRSDFSDRRWPRRNSAPRRKRLFPTPETPRNRSRWL